jgi:hypothetical protein
MYDFQEQLANEMLMYELDMERMYEDETFELDMVNAELQLASHELQDAEVEQAYDEMMASWLRMYVDLDLI